LVSYLSRVHDNIGGDRKKLGIGIFIGSITVVLAIGINVSYGLESDESLPYISTEDMNRVVDYCFNHADSPNPIQELINQGLLDPAFAGVSCSTMKLETDVQEFHEKSMQSFLEDSGIK
jgi:hypothetical protein